MLVLLYSDLAIFFGFDVIFYGVFEDGAARLFEDIFPLAYNYYY